MFEVTLLQCIVQSLPSVLPKIWVLAYMHIVVIVEMVMTFNWAISIE